MNDTAASAIDSEQQEESEHVPDSDDVSSPSLGASNKFNSSHQAYITFGLMRETFVH